MLVVDIDLLSMTANEKVSTPYTSHRFLHQKLTNSQSEHLKKAEMWETDMARDPIVAHIMEKSEMRRRYFLSLASFFDAGSISSEKGRGMNRSLCP